MYFVGIDGGGTRTTLGIADQTGREVIRQVGPPGIVDPRRPAATAELLVALVREAAEKASLEGPATALCAGLAGVGNALERQIVEATLLRARIAERVAVLSDGEIALFGAFHKGPGILVIAGTGSVAYGRSEDGRVERCGGWGMTLGDEGGGYALGRSGLRAALWSVDGRGPETELLPRLLEVLGLAVPEAIPPWIARADKSEVAMLAVHVLRTALRGDAVAREIMIEAALELTAHVDALVSRLRPWSNIPSVALHGGLAQDPIFAPQVRNILNSQQLLRLVEPAADAVTGAIDHARSLGSRST